MKIALASDHGGFEYKRMLIPFIEQMGHTIIDFGCYDDSAVDYSDFGFIAGEAVAKGECDRGIVICGTGIGMSIAANKVRTIRCALCTDPLMARLTREHNDTNMLALGGRIIGAELAKEIVRVWLSTQFSGEQRHARRIDKLSNYENK
ncbi:MAG: ribose 5-phosphate isomerase B [Clostridia bacterium]